MTVSLDQGIGAVAGSQFDVSPPVTTTYTLTATNNLGSTQAQTRVEVATVTLSPASATMWALDSLTLEASVTGQADTSVGWTASGSIPFDFDAGVLMSGAVGGTIQVTATSNAVPAAAATATITVVAPSPGFPDPTFADGGEVTVTPIGDAGLFGPTATVTFSDDSVVIAGVENDIVQAYKFLGNGQPDSRYGIDGLASFSSPNAVVYAAAVTTDDELLLAGGAGSTGWLAKFTPSGALDQSFAQSGIASVQLGSGAHPSVILERSDGEVFVAGYAVSTADFFLVAFTPTGSLDGAFGASGVDQIDFSSSNDVAFAGLLQSDGKILVVGSSSSKAAAVRVNSDGSLDSSFGSQGKVTWSLGTSSKAVHAFEWQGSLYLLALATVNSNQGLYLVRLAPDGSLDSAFGQGGTTFLGISSIIAFRGAAINSAGDLIVATSQLSPSFDLARFTLSGSIDSTFGSGGHVDQTFPSGPYSANLALDTHDRIVMGGFFQSGGSVAYLYRYWR